MSQDNYILKDIPGYEGLYAASSDGRIWSYPKSVKHPSGSMAQRHNGIWLKATPRGRGYLRVILVKDAFKKSISVHSLVARTFIPNPNNLPEVNHKDGNKLNNKVSNFEWCTSSYNHNHALATKLLIPQRGEMRYNHKLTEVGVKEIRRAYKKGGTITQLELSKKYGVSVRAIGRAIARQDWKHVA